jgi:hypothetical protein
MKPRSIAGFPLPVYIELVMSALVPTVKQFIYEYSRKWFAAVASYQGYIFVISEYKLRPCRRQKETCRRLSREQVTRNTSRNHQIWCARW